MRSGTKVLGYLVQSFNEIQITKVAYLSCKKFMRKGDGFPTTVGSLCVEPQMAPTIEPAPVIRTSKVLNVILELFMGECKTKEIKEEITWPLL